MALEELYTGKLQFTGVSDFGTSLEDIMGGKAPPPPAGARIDVSFAGTLTGKLNGELTGIDYINVRADGRFELNIRGTIVTPDGARIALEASGTAVPQPGSPVVRMTEVIKLTTGFESHAWVNALCLVGIGTVDPVAGLVEITIYR